VIAVKASLLNRLIEFKHSFQLKLKVSNHLETCPKRLISSLKRNWFLLQVD